MTLTQMGIHSGFISRWNLNLIKTLKLKSIWLIFTNINLFINMEWKYWYWTFLKNKKFKKIMNFQCGVDKVLIFLMPRIDLQMINVQMDYFRYHSLMNFKKGIKIFILLIAYPIHILCSINILTRMSLKKKQKDKLFAIL